jgi:hypothetical protein
MVGRDKISAPASNACIRRRKNRRSFVVETETVKHGREAVASQASGSQMILARWLNG